MTVYVVGFKLAGPCSSVKAMWKKIAEAVSLEPPTPMERYLGCSQTSFCSKTGLASAFGNGLPSVGKHKGLSALKKVRVMEYDLMSFIRQSLEAYESLVGATSGSTSVP